MDGDTAVATPTTWTGSAPAVQRTLQSAGIVVDEYPGYAKVLGPVDLDELKARLKAGERILWDDNDTVPTKDELTMGGSWVKECAAKGLQVRKWRKVSWPTLQFKLGKKCLSFRSDYWGVVKSGKKDNAGHDIWVSELTHKLQKAGRKAVQPDHKCTLRGEAAERSAKPPTPPLATLEKPTVLTE